MAEMIFKDFIYKNSKRYMFTCASRATSIEELGHEMYPQARQKLVSEGVTCESHKAIQIKKEEQKNVEKKIEEPKKEDYNLYDYIIVMEQRNKRDVIQIVGPDVDNKIHLLLEFTGSNKDIDDPWYSGDFDTAYNEINEGCLALYNYLLNKEVDDEI